MAIEMRTSVTTVSPEEFKGFAERLLSQIKTFPGFIAHFSGPLDEGFYITEIWESEDAHQRWVAEVVEPMMRAAGRTGPPPTQYHRVENVVLR